MFKKIRFILIGLICGIFVSCETVENLEIQDYIKLDNESYLVVYYHSGILKNSRYKVSVVSFCNLQWFISSYNQGSIYFEIDNYDKIEINQQTIIFFTDHEPEIRIKNFRSFEFQFQPV